MYEYDERRILAWLAAALAGTALVLRGLMRAYRSRTRKRVRGV